MVADGCETSWRHQRACSVRYVTTNLRTQVLTVCSNFTQKAELSATQMWEFLVKKIRSFWIESVSDTHRQEKKLVHAKTILELEQFGSTWAATGSRIICIAFISHIVNNLKYFPKTRLIALQVDLHDLHVVNIHSLLWLIFLHPLHKLAHGSNECWNLCFLSCLAVYCCCFMAEHEMLSQKRLRPLPFFYVNVTDVDLLNSCSGYVAC